MRRAAGGRQPYEGRLADGNVRQQAGLLRLQEWPGVFARLNPLCDYSPMRVKSRSACGVSFRFSVLQAVSRTVRAGRLLRNFPAAGFSLPAAAHAPPPSMSLPAHRRVSRSPPVHRDWCRWSSRRRSGRCACPQLRRSRRMHRVRCAAVHRASNPSAAGCRGCDGNKRCRAGGRDGGRRRGRFWLRD